MNASFRLVWIVLLLLLVLPLVKGQESPGTEGNNLEGEGSDWTPDNPKAAEQYIKSGGSLEPGVVSTEDIAKYMNVIKSSRREGDLVSRVNEEGFPRSELTLPSTILAIKGAANVGAITSNQIGLAGGIEAFSTESRAFLKAEAMKDHLNSMKDKTKQKELNPTEFNKAANLLTGLPLTITLGPNGGGGEFHQGSFTVASAQSLGIGTSIVTNGQGIEYKEGKLSVRTAESFVHNSDARGFNATNIETTEKGFSVNHAEEIRMFCHNNGEIVLQDLTQATVYDSEKLILQLDKDSTSEIKDCNANTASMTALSDSATLIISKDGSNPEYFLSNVSLDFNFQLPFGFFSENVTARDPTYVITSGNAGIFRVQGTDAYEYLFNDPNTQTQWKFRGKSSTFFLQVRKTSDQQKDYACTNCVLFDLIDHRMYVKGAVEILRQPRRQDGSFISREFYPVIQQSDERTNLTVQLNEPNTEMLYTYLTTNTPEVIINPSTYLSIKETTYQGTTTRFFRITPGTDFSKSITHQFSTTYSPNPVKIASNNLDYQTTTQGICNIQINAQERTPAFLKAIQQAREETIERLEEHATQFS